MIGFRAVRGVRASRYARLSTSSFDHESFAKSFLNEVKEMGTDPAQSSKVLRKLVKSKELKFMDIRHHSKATTTMRFEGTPGASIAVPASYVPGGSIGAALDLAYSLNNVLNGIPGALSLRMQHQQNLTQSRQV
jgi:hypothetical protein